jgi:hypothetical protein
MRAMVMATNGRDQHLGRYGDEIAFRLNNGNVRRSTLDRLDSFVASTPGRRGTGGSITKSEW